MSVVMFSLLLEEGIAPSDLRDLGLAAGNVISSREDMFVNSEPKLYII
jgi:hypothetical protein